MVIRNNEKIGRGNIRNQNALSPDFTMGMVSRDKDAVYSFDWLSSLLYSMSDFASHSSLKRRHVSRSMCTCRYNTRRVMYRAYSDTLPHCQKLTTWKSTVHT